jgi:hypothetical protein
MESLFVLVHEVWNLHPLLHYSFLWEYVVQTHYYCFFYEKRNFIMRLGVVEKAHWYGANIWSKNIFKVAFNFLFLDFLALTMFTNICITKFIFDHFWHVIMGPQTTYTMSNACFIFHGWCMVLLLINWMFCLWWWYKVIVCGKISKHVVCGVQFMYMFK